MSLFDVPDPKCFHHDLWLTGNQSLRNDSKTLREALKTICHMVLLGDSQEVSRPGLAFLRSRLNQQVALLARSQKARQRDAAA